MLYGSDLRFAPRLRGRGREGRLAPPPRQPQLPAHSSTLSRPPPPPPTHTHPPTHTTAPLTVGPPYQPPPTSCALRHAAPHAAPRSPSARRPPATVECPAVIHSKETAVKGRLADWTTHSTHGGKLTKDVQGACEAHAPARTSSALPWWLLPQRARVLRRVLRRVQRRRVPAAAMGLQGAAEGRPEGTSLLASQKCN